MKEIGSVIKQKATEDIHTWMEQSTRGHGRKINNTVKARSHGLMELCMRVIMYSARSMALVNSSGQMVPPMKDNSSTTISRVKVFIAGLMEELSMGNGSLIKCTARVFSPGQMAGSTKGNTSKIRNREMVYSIGLMVANTLVNG